MTRHRTDDSFSKFVASIRATVAPVAHLTDEQIAAQGWDPPVIKLLLGLRANLREYDAERDRAFGQPHRGHK
jgi:hypothetical protein